MSKTKRARFFQRSIGLAELSLFFVLGMGMVAASAQTVERVGVDRVSVHAEGMALQELLREMKDVIPIEVLLIDSTAEKKRVRVHLNSVTFSHALSEILESAHVNYVLQGGRGTPYRIFAGSPTESSIPLNQMDEEGEATKPSQRPELLLPESPTESTIPSNQMDEEGEATEPSQMPELPLPPVRQATGDAHLIGSPDARRVAATAAMLGVGFLVGCMLTKNRKSATIPPSPREEAAQSSKK